MQIILTLVQFYKIIFITSKKSGISENIWLRPKKAGRSFHIKNPALRQIVKMRIFFVEKTTFRYSGPGFLVMQNQKKILHMLYIIIISYESGENDLLLKRFNIFLF